MPGQSARSVHTGVLQPRLGQDGDIPWDLPSPVIHKIILHLIL